jgi:hypothetical protein
MRSRDLRRAGSAYDHVLRQVGCREPGASGVTVPTKEENEMNMTLSLAPIVSLIAGILILLVPRLLNYIVAIYLIVIGVIGLVNGGNIQF